MLGCLLTLSCSAHAAATTSAEIEAALERYGAIASRALPALDPGQRAAVAAGDTVSLREYIDVEQPDGAAERRILVAGYQLVERPRLLVWLATLDVGTTHSAALTEHLVGVNDQGGAMWYQHMDLPWPLRNRHWMIRSRKNLTVADTSGGQIWEHQWQLSDDGVNQSAELLASSAVNGLGARDARSAIYLPLNRGAWTMIDLGDDRTLVVTHALAVMGGWIPDEWVARLVARQLGDVLQNLARRADRIHVNYTAEPPVFTGDGTPIGPTLALEAWRDYSTPQAGNLTLLPRTERAAGPEQ